MNDFTNELNLIEKLITDGDLGEARFTVRRILINQKQKTGVEEQEARRFIEFLNKLQHTLLVYESLTDIQRMISMIQQARYRHGATDTSMTPSKNSRVLRELLSGGRLGTFSKAKNKIRK